MAWSLDTECEEPRCAEGQESWPGVPGWTQITPAGGWLGPGNTNVRWEGGWVGSTPPPYPPSYTGPGSTQPPAPDQCTVWASRGPPVTCTYDRFKTSVGDPRVEYAQVYSGHAEGCVCHWQPPYALCSSALPWRLVSSISQYFSVFLSISQIAEPSISQIAEPSISQIAEPRSQYTQILVYLRLFSKARL